MACEAFGFLLDLAVGAKDGCMEWIGVAGPEHRVPGIAVVWERISVLIVSSKGTLILT